jgi:hypothetical protein
LSNVTVELEGRLAIETAASPANTEFVADRVTAPPVVCATESPSPTAPAATTSTRSNVSLPLALITYTQALHVSVRLASELVLAEPTGPRFSPTPLVSVKLTVAMPSPGPSIETPFAGDRPPALVYDPAATDTWEAACATP